MASPPSLPYDTFYHIYNRGTNRENIFVEERNYEYFLQLYTRHIEPVAQTFAYCLLRNHFHLLVRIKAEEEILQSLQGSKVTLKHSYPSQSFSNFFNAYARTINTTYARTGSLFQHPFGRVIITSDRQFFQVITYIHQNPQKHGFVSHFSDWPYSSYHTLLSAKPTHLRRDDVLKWFGGVDNLAATHQHEMIERQMAAQAQDRSLSRGHGLWRDKLPLVK